MTVIGSEVNAVWSEAGRESSAKVHKLALSEVLIYMNNRPYFTLICKITF